MTIFENIALISRCYLSMKVGKINVRTVMKTLSETDVFFPGYFLIMVKKKFELT